MPHNSPVKVAALLVAAGRGARVKSVGLPKQYRVVAGEPLLRMTLKAFLSHPRITDVLCVIHPDDGPLYDDAARGLAGAHKLRVPAPGGATRQESVYHGLTMLQDVDLVLIHDGVRPFVSAGEISALVDILNFDDTLDGAILCAPVTDTLKAVKESRLVNGPDRSRLLAAQTPQAFRIKAILEAHEAAHIAGRSDFTDDAAVVADHGGKVVPVEGSRANIKVTTDEDFTLCEALLGGTETRTGIGYDVHSFTDGDRVTLCGIEIAYSRKLSGHSDADVALHALTDALLGTIGAGDIGDHFPPSDPQWKGAASRIFVEHACKLLTAKGGRIVNCDIALIAEEPRIGPHRNAMRAFIAGICAIDIDRVGVKATTNERMGFVGRGEGIAALATVSAELPRRKAD